MTNLTLHVLNKEGDPSKSNKTLSVLILKVKKKNLLILVNSDLLAYVMFYLKLLVRLGLIDLN